MTNKEIRNKTLRFFKENPNKAFTFKEIAKNIGAKSGSAVQFVFTYQINKKFPSQFSMGIGGKNNNMQTVKYTGTAIDACIQFYTQRNDYGSGKRNKNLDFTNLKGLTEEVKNFKFLDDYAPRTYIEDPEIVENWNEDYTPTQHAGVQTVEDW